MRPCLRVLCVGVVAFVALCLPCRAEMPEPAISLASCIEEDAKRLKVSNEALCIAFRLLCEAQMGVLSRRANSPTCSEKDNSLDPVMVRRERKLTMLPSFVDAEAVRSAVTEESADGLEHFGKERLLQVAWMTEVTLVNLELRKSETGGRWELEFPGMPGLDPDLSSSEHLYRESLPSRARVSWYPFLRSAQAEVSTNSENVPANITG